MVNCKIIKVIPNKNGFTVYNMIVCDRSAPPHPSPPPVDLLGLLVGLLFGQLQWVVDDSNAILTGVLAAGKLTPQN